MRVVPHILLQKGDIVIMPWAQKSETVEVVWLIDGQLLVHQRTNRFILPYGFYFKKISPVGLTYYEPVLD